MGLWRVRWCKVYGVITSVVGQGTGEQNCVHP